MAKNERAFSRRERGPREQREKEGSAFLSPEQGDLLSVLARTGDSHGRRSLNVQICGPAPPGSGGGGQQPIPWSRKRDACASSCSLRRQADGPGHMEGWASTRNEVPGPIANSNSAKLIRMWRLTASSKSVSKVTNLSSRPAAMLWPSC